MTPEEILAWLTCPSWCDGDDKCPTHRILREIQALRDENEALRARNKELLTLLAQGYELILGESLGDAS